MAQRTPTTGAALWPTARQLLRLLAVRDGRTREQLTNSQLANELGCSSRTVNYALQQLQDHGLVAISRRTPHPTDDATARSIHILPAARQLHATNPSEHRPHARRTR